MDSSAEAFAPAAISNFFTIDDGGIRLSETSDLRHVGARGGGYMLSKGVRSRASVDNVPGSTATVDSIIVDGDPAYDTRTTRMAAEMLLHASGVSGVSVRIDQSVEVPVGQGFGASAASALSAVDALAAALSLKLSIPEVAYYAHAADIVCRTGLGTVSVIYRYGGAGIITKAGAPGVAKVKRVPVPKGTKVVTASVAPYAKAALLSGPDSREKVNRLGKEALLRAEELTLESLVRAGEVFSESLGLESPELRRLIKTARSNGALGSSQNMVGHAVHAVVWEEYSERVAGALQADPSSPLVDVYEFGEVHLPS